MSKLIYETPMGVYQIRELVDFFEETGYCICKYDEHLAKMDGVSNYYIIYHCSNLKYAYKWLLDHKIISKDEFKHQTESL